jgi:WD40 repeat protein
VLVSAGSSFLRAWSLPSFELIREFGASDGWEMEPNAFMIWVLDGRVLTAEVEGSRYLIRWWPLEAGAPSVAGRWDDQGNSDWGIDPAQGYLEFARGRELVRRPLDSLESDRQDVVVVRNPAEITWFVPSPLGDRYAAFDETGDTRIWSTGPGTSRPLRIVRGLDAPFWFNPLGAGFHTGRASGMMIWDIEGPPDAEPRIIRFPSWNLFPTALLHPGGRIAAVVGPDRALFWPRTGPYCRVLTGHEGVLTALAFVGDTGLLASASRFDQTIRLWPLSPQSGETARVLWERWEPASGFSSIAADPTGRYLLAACYFVDGAVFLVPIAEDGPAPTRLWPDDGSRVLSAVTFSSDGRRAAAGAVGTVSGEGMVIRVWDLETGDEQVLPLRVGGEETGSSPYHGGAADLRFTPEGDLLSSGLGGIRLWKLDTGEAEWLTRVPDDLGMGMDASQDTRYLLTAEKRPGSDNPGNLRLFDLEEASSHPIETHGDFVTDFALDRSGTIIVTGGTDGVIRVGPADGSEPHLLFGNESAVPCIAISPDGRWIASGGGDATIRLWPMPDVTKPPLHTLPHDELITKLKNLTNLRVVRDEASTTGWQIEIGPFPGWATVPTW